MTQSSSIRGSMHRDRRASWRFKWAEEERKELEKGGARAEDIIRLLD